MIPEKIEILVNTFGMNIENYKSRKERKETEIRKDYIDPLFELMGWNIRNEGLAEYEKEVAAEYSVKDKTGRKKADYCFKLNGNPMFFVEAKDPYINIEENKDVAFQLRSYCWNAKVPVGILTDFEEFAVYDGRYEPKAGDSANVARIHYFKYTDFKDEDKWSKISGLFSKKAVASGALNTYINTVKVKRGVLTVDEAFLKDMELWREILAVNITSLNPELTRKEINFAVQRTIDRIVFLRICEDRDIEPYENIQKLITSGNIYKGLIRIFKDADRRYNSGIFYFKEEKGRLEGVDTFTPAIKIDDESLKKIIERLYYPSPYNFAVMPADILGQIYERFLGKVISLTPERVVTVEEKPEVRKAGGVYYTPTYIVDYIVKNTIGKLTEGKTPAHLEKMKFLDPACGSGSFLIHAYQYLLDWHLNWYLKDNADKYLKGKKAVLIKDKNGNIRLKIDLRKQILLNNIFGADIDFQAVEVTKLSLLLKVLEGEDDFTIQQGLFKERALPDLGKNIKCGNSLIGSDFYHGKQISLISPEEQERINTFDWDLEFPNIMKEGGFDAVIGNPPYIQSRSGRLTEIDKTYFEEHFITVQYQINTYGLFIEKGINLLKNKGLLGMIVPNYWLSTDSDKKLRNILFINNKPIEIINVYCVFDKVTVDTLIIIAGKESSAIFPKSFKVRSINRTYKTIRERLLAIQQGEWAYIKQYNIESLKDEILISFSEHFNLNADSILGDYFDFKFGMKPYEKGKGVPSQTRKMMEDEIYNSNNKIDESYLPLIRARNIKRYYLVWENNWIKYGQNLAAPRSPDIFRGKRILIRRILNGNYLDGIYTDENYICNTDVITLLPKTDRINLLYILGILLSRVSVSYLKSQNVNLDRIAFPKINANTLEKFPIPIKSLNSHLHKFCQDSMISLVEQMLSLHKQIAEANIDQQKTILQRQIESTDSQIDQLVYNLYDLTEEEIKIVEEDNR